MLTIDLNADLGEDQGDDTSMLDVVSSANLACGMHAGNLAVMAETIAAAWNRDVRVGAHPSWPDRTNFGRTSMAATITENQFAATLRAQLDAFSALSGGNTPYIKAHGALYNDAATNASVARRLVMAAKDRHAAVMHQPNTWVQHYAEERGVPFIAEVFADRAYLPDGRLAPRNMDGSVLHNPEQIAQRVVRMVTNGDVETIDGGVFAFADVHSVCVHGDTEGAVEIALAVRSALEDAGITISATPASQTTAAN